MTGKHCFSANAIAEHFNENVLNSRGDLKIKKSALNQSVATGKHGKLPPKRGRPVKIPIELTSGIATHATMQQLTGEGEVSRQTMVVTTQALIQKTSWEGKFHPEGV